MKNISFYSLDYNVEFLEVTLSFFELVKNIYACSQQGYVALNGTMDKFLFGGRNVTDEISAHM